ASANQIAGVALGDQLGDRAAGEDRVIVGVRRDAGQYFAAMGLATCGPLNERFAARGDVRRAGLPCGRGLAWGRFAGQEGGGKRAAKEFASLHGGRSEWAIRWARSRSNRAAQSAQLRYIVARSRRDCPAIAGR